MIDKDNDISTKEIIEKTYDQAPSNISVGKFEYCIRGIRVRHTLGQRPSKR